MVCWLKCVLYFSLTCVLLQSYIYDALSEIGLRIFRWAVSTIVLILCLF